MSAPETPAIELYPYTLEMKAMLERPAHVVIDAPPTGRRVLFFTLVALTMVGAIVLLSYALSAGGFSPGDAWIFFRSLSIQSIRRASSHRIRSASA